MNYLMHEKFRLRGVTKVDLNDIIYYEEDVFVRNGNRSTCIGTRCVIAQVVKRLAPGEVSLKIVKSSGANALPINSEIPKPISNLMRGYYMNHLNFDDKYTIGGHLEGKEEDGKVFVKLDNTNKGGISVGAKHTDGGIKGSVGTEQRPIEFEGEEIILTAPVANNPEKYEFDGQQMTGREIASKINQDNGGVSFAEGGSPSCKCSKKEYKFGGETVSDAQIIRYINFMNQPLAERISGLK